MLPSNFRFLTRLNPVRSFGKNFSKSFSVGITAPKTQTHSSMIVKRNLSQEFSKKSCPEYHRHSTRYSITTREVKTKQPFFQPFSFTKLQKLDLT